MCNNSYSLNEIMAAQNATAQNATAQNAESGEKEGWNTWVLRPGAPGDRFDRDIRLAPKESPFIGIDAVTVHNGVYHADDVVAVGLLLLVNQGTPDVIRTRNPDEFRGIVVDVGEGPFDHHGRMKGQDDEGIPWCGVTRLWRAGLNEALFHGDPVAQSWFFENVLKAIAFQDNGEHAKEGTPHPFEWVRYSTPPWTVNDPDFDSGFMAAVNTAMPLLAAFIHAADARSRAVAELQRLDHVNAVIQIPAGLPGWQDELAGTPVQFVVFEGTPDTPWFAQAVPPLVDGKVNWMQQKCPFPDAWGGKRFEELEACSGVKDAVFCHAGKFISGWRTKEAAIEACKAALTWNK